MAVESSGTIHLASSRILLDGALRAGRLELTMADGAPRLVRVLPQAGDPAPADAPLVDVGDAPVVPAPLDLHFHGCGGSAVPPAGSAAAIDEALAPARAALGTSHQGLPDPAYEWVATLPLPSPSADDVLEQVERAARQIATGETSCIGLRLEGLFINPQRAGVWPPGILRPPDIGLLQQLHDAAVDGGSRLLVLDVAPELPGATPLIEHARQLGIVLAMAHSDADCDQARRAIDAGASLATHTWNAMRPLRHRDPGIVGAVLTDERVTCELICDGVHVDPLVARLTARCKGPGGWVAVSDASPFAGCPPGSYDWAGSTVTHDGGSLRDAQGRLAGSACLLDAALHRLETWGTPPLERLAAIGAVPRRVLDPSRPLGLVAGDPVLVTHLPA